MLLLGSEILLWKALQMKRIHEESGILVVIEIAVLNLYLDLQEHKWVGKVLIGL